MLVHYSRDLSRKLYSWSIVLAYRNAANARYRLCAQTQIDDHDRLWWPMHAVLDGTAMRVIVVVDHLGQDLVEKESYLAVRDLKAWAMNDAVDVSSPQLFNRVLRDEPEVSSYRNEWRWERVRSQPGACFTNAKTCRNCNWKLILGRKCLTNLETCHHFVVR